jgi:hypothetical protein
MMEAARCSKMLVFYCTTTLKDLNLTSPVTLLSNTPSSVCKAQHRMFNFTTFNGIRAWKRVKKVLNNSILDY